MFACVVSLLDRRPVSGTGDVVSSAQKRCCETTGSRCSVSVFCAWTLRLIFSANTQRDGTEDVPGKVRHWREERGPLVRNTLTRSKGPFRL